MCEVGPLHLRIDYVPLRSYRSLYGNLSARQLVHLLPVSDVCVSFERLRLTGLDSWEAVLQASLVEWQPQLVSQLHRYLSGIAPVKSLVNIGNALGRLLLAPTRPAPLRGIHTGGVMLARTVLEDAAAVTTRLLSVAQALLEHLDATLGDSSAAHAPLRHVAGAAQQLRDTLAE